MSSSKPIYLQIYDQISAAIKTQQYTPGDLLPTEAELCKTYSTSRPTVAKALGLLSKEKLVKRRPGFGTQVLPPRQSALSAGLLIPRLHQTEIFGPISTSLAEAAGMEAMRIIRPLELDRKSDPRQIAEELTDRFIQEKVNGVFFTPVEHIPDQERFNMGILDRLNQKGIHVVLLDRDVYSWPQHTPHDLIGIDNIEAGYTIGSHLLDQGCRRLAFVSADNPAMTVTLRRIGSHEALVQRGDDPRDMLDIEFLPDAPEQAAKRLIDNQCDGIICANDLTAAPLLRALLDLGVSIPGSMRVCGFDDVKYASLLSVPLTSYHQPCTDIGQIAALTMINRIKKPSSPAQRIALEGRLIIRESSS